MNKKLDLMVSFIDEKFSDNNDMQSQNKNFNELYKYIAKFYLDMNQELTLKNEDYGYVYDRSPKLQKLVEFALKMFSYITPKDYDRILPAILSSISDIIAAIKACI